MLNSKRKGSEGERELQEIFLAHEIPCRRNQQGPLAPTPYQGGHANPDLLCLINNNACHIEVKRCERLRFSEALKQAVNDAAGTGRTPVLCSRRNHDGWIISLYLNDFFQLINK